MNSESKEIQKITKFKPAVPKSSIEFTIKHKNPEKIKTIKAILKNVSPICHEITEDKQGQIKVEIHPNYLKYFKAALLLLNNTKLSEQKDDSSHILDIYTGELIIADDERDRNDIYHKINTSIETLKENSIKITAGTMYAIKQGVPINLIKELCSINPNFSLMIINMLDGEWNWRDKSPIDLNYVREINKLGQLCNEQAINRFRLAYLKKGAEGVGNLIKEEYKKLEGMVPDILAQGLRQAERGNKESKISKMPIDIIEEVSSFFEDKDKKPPDGGVIEDAHIKHERRTPVKWHIKKNTKDTSKRTAKKPQQINQHSSSPPTARMFANKPKKDSEATLNESKKKSKKKKGS